METILSMSQLEQTVNLRIKDIVEKLQKMDCTLLGSKDDAWILELLFSPGFHRYHLIEWILSKLGYDVGKLSGPQNSAEERLKKLQSTISDLGIFQENCHDIIKGTATVKEQLDFWCHLVDVIWLKHEIIMNSSISESDEGIALSPEKRKSIKCLDEEYEHATFAINTICSTVNIKHLFEHKINFLAPDVEREIKNMSTVKSEKFAIPTLQDIKSMIKEPAADTVEQYKTLLSLNSLSLDTLEDNTALDTELNQLEEKLHSVSTDLQDIVQQSFNCTYNDLKPLIPEVETDTSPDVGEYFKKLESSLESFSQLARSFPKLESSFSKFSEVVSNLEDLSSQEELSDPKYLKVFKMVNEENC